MKLDFGRARMSARILNQINRRSLIAAMVTLTGCPASVRAQVLRPLTLRLVRRSDWQELMMRNHCLVSDLYISEAGWPRSDLGRKVSVALEQPWRANQTAISAIPTGDYVGSVLTTGRLGWRIALAGVGARINVRIHVGNFLTNTTGCILPGMGVSAADACSVLNSRAALDRLQMEYGSNTARLVALRIQ